MAMKEDMPGAVAKRSAILKAVKWLRADSDNQDRKNALQEVENFCLADAEMCAELDHDDAFWESLLPIFGINKEMMTKPSDKKWIPWIRYWMDRMPLLNAYDTNFEAYKVYYRKQDYYGTGSEATVLLWAKDEQEAQEKFTSRYSTMPLQELRSWFEIEDISEFTRDTSETVEAAGYLSGDDDDDDAAAASLFFSRQNLQGDDPRD